MIGNLIPNEEIRATSLSIQLESSGLRIQIEAIEQLFPWNSTQAILKNWLKDNSIQLQKIQHIAAELRTELFLLLPFEFDSPLYRLGFLEKAFGQGSLDGHEVHEQVVEFAEANLLFLIPSVWKDLISTIFPLANVHYTHLLGNELAKTKAYIHPRIQLHLFEKSALIIFIQQGKLNLANVFPFESATELAFYLHSIREAYHIHWNAETFQIRGPEQANRPLLRHLIDLQIPLELT